MSVSAFTVGQALDALAPLYGFCPFDFTNTGGGCMAYQAESYGASGYVLVTGEDSLRNGDLSDFGSGVTVGLYDDETGECVGGAPVFVPFASDDLSVADLVSAVCRGLSSFGLTAECSTCVSGVARWRGSLWDGFKGRSVSWLLCDSCFADDVANGGVAEDWRAL